MSETDATCCVVEWTLPDDPPWVSVYLDALRAGQLQGYACTQAGVHPTTALRWRKKRKENRVRYIAAMQVGVAILQQLCRNALVQGAQRGNSWHLSRLMALVNKSEWKRINKVLSDADPDRQTVDVTGAGASFTDLIELSEKLREGKLETMEDQVENADADSDETQAEKVGKD